MSMSKVRDYVSMKYIVHTMIYDDMVVFGPDLGQVIGGCGTGNSQQHRGRKHNKRVVVKLTPQINRSQRCLEHPNYRYS